jgi:dephospho-CoA kinase
VLVGITGGIGSGKSTLARLLARRGAALVDADRLGHQVLENPQVIAELVGAFGDRIADSSGRIRRRELGRLAFADPAESARLNRIVRPHLEARLWQEIGRALGAAADALVVVDAALLYEWGVAEHFDLVIAVDAPVPLRRRRAADRQGLSEEEVELRMARQMPAQEKVARADLVVRNGGTLAELEQRAEEVWQHLLGLRMKPRTAREP